MRMPDTSSCIMALMASSCACSLENRGFAFPRQRAMIPTSNGNAHNTINPKRRFSRNIKYMLPKVSIEIRIIPRINVETKFCTWVMSLVTLVTKEPVPKRSSCGKENVMILRKQSFRISLPIFWLDTWTNALLREPHKPPNRTRPIICNPSIQIRCRLGAPPLCTPRTPSSTIRLIIPGCIKSMSTSPIINKPAAMAKNRYRLIYFHMINFLRACGNLHDAHAHHGVYDHHDVRSCPSIRGDVHA